MEYIGLKSKFGDFTLTDKAYTYAYNNDSHENSADPVAGGSVTKFPGAAYAGPAYVNDSPNTLANTGEGQTKASGIINNDDPAGRIKVNAYRGWATTWRSRTARIPRLRSRSACGASTSRPTAMPTFSITAPPTWRPTPRTGRDSGPSTPRTRRGPPSSPATSGSCTSITRPSSPMPT